MRLLTETRTRGFLWEASRGLCPPCNGARTTSIQDKHPVACCHSRASPLWQVSFCLFVGFLVTALGTFQRIPQIRAGLRSAPTLHLPSVLLPLAATVPATDNGYFLTETSAFTFIPDTPELDKRPMSASRRNTLGHGLKGRHQWPLQTLPLQSHTAWAAPREPYLNPGIPATDERDQARGRMHRPREGTA